MLGRTLALLTLMFGLAGCSSLQVSPEPNKNVPAPAQQVAEPDEPEYEVVMVAKVEQPVTVITEPVKIAPVVTPIAKPAIKQVAKVAPKPPVKATAPPKTVVQPMPPVIAKAPIKANPPLTVIDKSIPPSVVAASTKKDWRWNTVPEGMKKLVQTVKDTLAVMWADFKMPSFFMAMIEQETCISPTNSRCGSTKAELKTKREYGFGLIQFTKAYDKQGRERFNVWQELRDKDPVLAKHWTWDNRFDQELQMRAAVIKNKMNYSSVRFDVANEMEHMAFTAATNNSGSPITDRRLCMADPRCDPRYWFDQWDGKLGVESFSTKSRVSEQGYGKSFFAISREYPRMVLFIRREKYIPLTDNESQK